MIAREITRGTKEWADINVNCITGCLYDCRYCYAKVMANRFGRIKRQNWTKVRIRKDVVDKTFRKYRGRVMFPSTHDIFEIPAAKKACFTVLKKLLQAGNEVLITSKPKHSVVEGIINQFGEYLPQIQFRFTITSLNNTCLSFWEPNAPPFEERLNSLILAYQHGFKTSVSVEPFLDSDPSLLMRTLSPYITESIWLGPMNYIPRRDIKEEELKEYERIRNIYSSRRLIEVSSLVKDIPLVRFKDSFIHKIDRQFLCSNLFEK